MSRPAIANLVDPGPHTDAERTAPPLFAQGSTTTIAAVAASCSSSSSSTSSSSCWSNSWSSSKQQQQLLPAAAAAAAACAAQQQQQQLSKQQQQQQQQQQQWQQLTNVLVRQTIPSGGSLGPVRDLVLDLVGESARSAAEPTGNFLVVLTPLTIQVPVRVFEAEDRGKGPAA
uniref:Uncharacterized protein n=1 Tax=Ananas comosus var. bracteatus TaxID=296719 RepID=A0A6V7PH90_ANACO|nr:unnamed protein product [Ananas comosus var. bracteatus]